MGSTPLFVVLLRAVTGDRPAVVTLAGVAVGLAGLALLLRPGNRPEDVPLGPTLLLLLSAGSWAAGSFACQHLRLPADPLVSAGWQMLFGGTALTLGGLLAGEADQVRLGAFSGDSMWAFAYLLVAGSLIAYTAYAWLVRNAPISQVATYAYINPVIAVLLGWWILEEQISSATAAGGALIVASVVAIVVRESPRSAIRSPATETRAS